MIFYSIDMFIKINQQITPILMFIYKLFNNDRKFYDIINNLPIYSIDNNLTVFDDFFEELYQDLKYFKNDYDIKNTIYDLLIPGNNKYLTKIDYTTLLFGSFMSYSYGDNIEKIINIQDEQIFYNIIHKYSNKKLDPKLLPLDSSVNLTICEKVFNINTYLINFILCSNNYTKINSHLRINMITSYLPNNNKYFQQIINNLNLASDYSFTYISKKAEDFSKYKNELDNKEEILGTYLHNNVIINTAIDLKKIKKENKENYKLIFLHTVFKSLLLNNKFVNINDILSYIYCGSHLHLLNLILILRFDLLTVDLNQIYLIFAYGRLKVFNFLIENIPYGVFKILSQSNPLDLNIDFSYEYDIWWEYNWNEDISDVPIVGGFVEHSNLITFLLDLSREHNFTHIKWTNENQKKWILCALECKKYKFRSRDSYYFIDYNELLLLLGLEFDFNNKESIQHHINIFGKKITWNKIKLDCSEKFLDLFFDTTFEQN